MIIRLQTVVLVPPNDPEALMILKICQAAKIQFLVSEQAHGATLEAEPELRERLFTAFPNTKKLVIIEIPGPEIEKAMMLSGMEVVIIDHHRYDDLDRLRDKSSLEQFLEFFRISEDELHGFGFDPLLVRGVANIDQSFVWGLEKVGLSGADYERIIKHYRELLIEVEGPRRLESERLAEEIFAARQEVGGYVILRNHEAHLPVRDALSFVLAGHFKKATPNIILSPETIYVQDCEVAVDLQNKFGGFLYGGGKCWGKKQPSKELLHKVFVTLNLPETSLL